MIEILANCTIKHEENFFPISRIDSTTLNLKINFEYRNQNL